MMMKMKIHSYKGLIIHVLTNMTSILKHVVADTIVDNRKILIMLELQNQYKCPKISAFRISILAQDYKPLYRHSLICSSYHKDLA